MKNQNVSLIQIVEPRLRSSRMLEGLAGRSQGALLNPLSRSGVTDVRQEVEPWWYHACKVPRVVCTWLMLPCLAYALTVCSKPPARPPEKSLGRTAVVESMDHVGSNGEATYLALVKFDHETDLSFK